MKPASNKYAKSIAQLQAAETLIPLGAQTVSKSRLTLTPGIAPLFSDRAEGAHIWDIDGNQYIDLINSLAAVTMGHADPDINTAVIEQLPRGTTISLSHPIEFEVATLINELVPCAEMVRFGKNGSDATSAAIRLARAFTGRDNVLVCGYHGWHDWYIGTTPRGLGVPKAVAELATSVPFNDLEEVEKLLSNRSIAAMILEPMNTTWPKAGYLEGLRELCTKYGTLLIFDETITGFRFSKGGAQEYFNVTPDLASFGKGLANGYPLSAVAGKREYMMMLEDVFFSGTFGGELLSLTAAKVVLERIKSTDVVNELSIIGEKLVKLIEPLIEEQDLGQVLHFDGHPSWKFLIWNAPDGLKIDELKALFMQEMSRNGVLMLATHNISAAMDDDTLEIIRNAYAATLPIIKTAVESKSVHGLLDVEAVTPRLSVR